MAWLYAIGPTFLLILGGIISWALKARYDKLKEQEEILRGEKIKIYKKLLEPFFIILSDTSKISEATKIILSYQYKENAFIMRIFGSDSVIEAHNKLMKISYNPEINTENNPKIMIEAVGRLLLEIRKDIGNKKTKLNEIDTIRFIIKDIEKYYD